MIARRKRQSQDAWPSRFPVSAVGTCADAELAAQRLPLPDSAMEAVGNCAG